MSKDAKKHDSKLIRHSIIQSAISLALIAAILGFCCTINTSVAWFVRNNQVSADGMSVSVKNDTDTVAYLKSYPITNISGTEYTIFYGSESYVLPTNDPNEISYSSYKKALAVIIDITSDRVQGKRIEIFASTGIESLSLEDNFLSNCISVKRAGLGGEGNVIATTTGATEKFISVSSTETTKVDRIVLDTVTVNQNARVCYIIEYDIALLDHIHKAVRSVNAKADFVTYANDLEFIIY